MLWLFTENMNPGSTRISPDVLRESMERGVGYTSYEATLRTEDEQFLVFYGVLNQNPMEKVKYVVQTAPFFRVILMDTTVDPEEGGNG